MSLSHFEKIWVMLKSESYQCLAYVPGPALYDIMAGTEGKMKGDRRWHQSKSWKISSLCLSPCLFFCVSLLCMPHGTKQSDFGLHKEKHNDHFPTFSPPMWNESRSQGTFRAGVQLWHSKVSPYRWFWGNGTLNKNRTLNKNGTFVRIQSLEGERRLRDMWETCTTLRNLKGFNKGHVALDVYVLRDSIFVSDGYCWWHRNYISNHWSSTFISKVLNVFNNYSIISIKLESKMWATIVSTK